MKEDGTLSDRLEPTMPDDPRPQASDLFPTDLPADDAPEFPEHLVGSTPSRASADPAPPASTPEVPAAPVAAASAPADAQAPPTPVAEPTPAPYVPSPDATQELSRVAPSPQAAAFTAPAGEFPTADDLWAEPAPAPVDEDAVRRADREMLRPGSGPMVVFDDVSMVYPGNVTALDQVRLSIDSDRKLRLRQVDVHPSADPGASGHERSPDGRWTRSEEDEHQEGAVPSP